MASARNKRSVDNTKGSGSFTAKEIENARVAAGNWVTALVLLGVGIEVMHPMAPYKKRAAGDAGTSYGDILPEES